MRFPRFVPLLVCLTLNTLPLFAQSPNGNINGLVSDPSSAAVIGAEVVAVNDVTGVQYTTKSNSEAFTCCQIYLPALPSPGFQEPDNARNCFRSRVRSERGIKFLD